MTLRLLLDACLSRRLERSVAGDFDVLHMAGIDADADDIAVAAHARSTERVLVTRDKGFGDRALAGELPYGVVLMRLADGDAVASAAADSRVAEVVRERADRLARRPTVVDLDRVRSRRLDDWLPPRQFRTTQPR